MKFFSVAILAAFLCISVVSAKQSVDDIEIYLKQAECGISVMGKVVGDSELKEDYEKFATSVNKILVDDRKKCYAQEDGDKIQECLMNILVKILRPHTEFLNTVRTKNPEMELEITKQVKSQCSRPANLFELSPKKDNVSELLLKEFQCYEKAMSEAVSTDRNVEGLWSIFQPNMHHELELWTKCAESETNIDECKIDHWYYAQNILNNFIRKLLSTNTEIMNDYVVKIQSKCDLKRLI